jgi:hypothetical protein
LGASDLAVLTDFQNRPIALQPLQNDGWFLVGGPELRLYAFPFLGRSEEAWKIFRRTESGGRLSLFLGRPQALLLFQGDFIRQDKSQGFPRPVENPYVLGSSAENGIDHFGQGPFQFGHGFFPPLSGKICTCHANAWNMDLN